MPGLDEQEEDLQPSPQRCSGQAQGLQSERRCPVHCRKWIAKPNSWCAAEIRRFGGVWVRSPRQSALVRDWQNRPQREVSPRVPTFESWFQRGAAQLIADGTPGTRYPTMIYCRRRGRRGRRDLRHSGDRCPFPFSCPSFRCSPSLCPSPPLFFFWSPWRNLTEQSMPLQYPNSLVTFLRGQGVKYVVRHTPHGNAPTVVMRDGVTLIMGDASFSGRLGSCLVCCPHCCACAWLVRPGSG